MMTYLDIISEAISHFTKIPLEFVKERFDNFHAGDKKAMKMLHSVLQTKFPNKEGRALLEDLKKKKFSEMMQFFFNSISLYKKEVVRQSIVN